MFEHVQMQVDDEKYANSSIQGGPLQESAIGVILTQHVQDDLKLPDDMDERTQCITYRIAFLRALLSVD